MRDLGSLPGHASAAAWDINDAGTVVGQSIDPLTGQSLSFIWTHRTGMRELDASLGAVGSLATGINRSGQIAGSSNAGTGAFHAFLRDKNGDVLDLGAFPDGSGSSTASAVNDHGDVVGVVGDGVIVDAFLWDEHNGMQLLAEDAFVRDINDHGEVVGDTVGEPKRAFRWTASEGFLDLGALAGFDALGATASAINESGTIVGSSLAMTGPPHAFIWSAQSGMRDLNELVDPSSELASQAVLVIAQAINKDGWIAVDGFIPDPVDPYRGFLLAPRHGKAPCR